MSADRLEMVGRVTWPSMPEGTFDRGRMELLRSVMQRVVMEELPFDMNRWVAHEFSANDCGTSACAGGWLAREPSAQELGLVLGRHGTPTYAGIMAPFEALAAFLETSHDISVWLFSNMSYARNVQAYSVLCRVEMLLERED